MEISDEKLEEMELEKVRKDFEKEKSIPAGYIPIELSTKGKFGAPAKFHIRNFLTEDLISLALEDDEKVQLKVAEMLQGLILEPKSECDIMKFHEKEVTETLLKLYKTFYQSTLKNLTWEITDDDKEVIATECGGKDTDLYRRRIAAIERGDEKQLFDIDLNKIKCYPTPEKISGVARASKLVDGKPFVVEYTFPRYGDALLLKDFMMKLPRFEKGEKQFAAIRENVRFKQKMEQAWRDGEDVPLEKLPRFPEFELNKFKEYENEKAIFAVRCVKALHLKSIDGEDISELPLDQKLKYADDPRLDHTTFEQVNKLYNELKIGPEEEISALDPYLGKVVKIKYTFQVLTILQAIRDNKPDGTTIEFV